MQAHSEQGDAQLYTNGIFIGTIGNGQIVQGSGQIDGRAGGEIINNGTIIANDAGFVLGISGVHNPGSGEYRAEGDGVLGLNSGTMLTGLVFDTSGNGSVDVTGSIATANSITNNGQMGVPGQGRTLALIGPMTNNDTLTINTNDNIFNAHLRFDSNTQVNGSGDIVMIGNSNRDDAQIYTSPGITGTIGAGQTVSGSGWIDGRTDGTIIINGTVIGNNPSSLLWIDGNIDATGGGVFRGDEGVVSLDGGLVLNGGTFESVGDGAVSKTNNGVATLSGVTNNGTMSVLGSGGIIDLDGDLTNNGECLLNPDLNIFNAHIRAINNVTIDGSGTVRAALREQASAVEEGKADVLGLYMVTALHDQGELEGGSIEDYYTTFLASVFRSVRFGASSAHGRANMARFNFFQAMGAFAYDDESGVYRVDYGMMKKAMHALSEKLLRFQGDGDYAGVAEFMGRTARIGPVLQRDLDGLASAGIPVDIVFEQGVDVLGL